jgi:holo-[acyl-carrier protein] synthase
MIIGIGIDIAEVPRIAKSIGNPSFKVKVFSAVEIAYCDSKTNSPESYAARFAAKEAFFKALGTGWRGGMSFCEVEVKNDDLGKPEIQLLGQTAELVKDKNIKIIHVSLSHIKDVAMATVVLEG